MNVLHLASELIQHPTPNPPGAERPLAEFLTATLRDLGLQADVLPVPGAPPAQTNVFARLPAAPGSARPARPPLVLCGHLDTVPPGDGAWTRDPYRPTVEGERLYGLGASDMKGAIAAMSLAAARLAREQAAGRPLLADLLLAFTSGEETTSLGARALAASGLLDGAAGLVIGEPTGNRVGISEKGGMWVELTMRGRTAHGSLPHLGANAVAGLAAALSRLECGEGSPAADALRRALEAPEDPFLGRPTLTPTRLSGGVGNNVVPDRASATLDIRTLPGQSHGAIRKGIEAVAAEIATARGLRAELADLGERSPLATPEDHPLVRACAGAVEATLGRPAERCGLTGATDATEIVPALGIPFVICGPGQMAQAHFPDEFVEVGPLEASVEIYYRLARALCT
ncbi:MAG TPA: M20 family metallopeptidase [Chloroflexota bacterium]|nr:M20 family metallopeptidase [Chloroflexota bacterium]